MTPITRIKIQRRQKAPVLRTLAAEGGQSWKRILETAKDVVSSLWLDSNSATGRTLQSAFRVFRGEKSLCFPWRAKALFQRDGGCVLPPSFTSARQAAVKPFFPFGACRAEASERRLVHASACLCLLRLFPPSSDFRLRNASPRQVGATSAAKLRVRP
jgi:hypothetical protein